VVVCVHHERSIMGVGARGRLLISHHGVADLSPRQGRSCLRAIGTRSTGMLVRSWVRMLGTQERERGLHPRAQHRDIFNSLAWTSRRLRNRLPQNLPLVTHQGWPAGELCCIVHHVHECNLSVWLRTVGGDDERWFSCCTRCTRCMQSSRVSPSGQK
jgi:hypothetical protein